MSKRAFNFSAGPAILPEEVLREAQEAIWDLGGTGIGVLEHSHRGKAIDEVFTGTEAALREVADVPDDVRLLFLQGGASLQFAMLPANYLGDDATADYLNTGSWSKKAIAEASLFGNVHVAASSEDTGFDRVPPLDAVRWSEAPVYVHYTSNNTIFGTQFHERPTPPEGAWLACDASSDLFSRPIDLRRYGLVYAGAQKNLGPAGLTLVMIREELLERRVRDLPTVLRYDIQAKNDSRYNTPPVFGVYLLGRVMRWIERQGGLVAMARQNEAKAKLLYDAIDASDFYRGTAHEGSRSLMNVTFRIADQELEPRFLAEAEKAGFPGLKGHRSVGGMRASIYNAFPRAGCEALAAFMRDFESRNG
jgi:phosphoserine aminotransferase